MMATLASPLSFLAKLVGWWRERGSVADELDEHGADFEHLAHDIGLSASDLRLISARGGNSSRQLPLRLSALGLDRKALSRAAPDVLRDLERVCSLCGQKPRCGRDLAVNPADPIWRDYCPNVPTLDALRKQSNDNTPPAA